MCTLELINFDMETIQINTQKQTQLKVFLEESEIFI